MTHTGTIEMLCGQNHDPQLREFASKCFEAGIRHAEDVYRLRMDAIQMLCQGAELGDLAEDSQRSITVQDVAKLRDKVSRLQKICYHASCLVNDLPPGSNAWADMIRKELA